MSSRSSLPTLDYLAIVITIPLHVPSSPLTPSFIASNIDEADDLQKVETFCMEQHIYLAQNLEKWKEVIKKIFEKLRAQSAVTHKRGEPGEQ